MVYCASSLALAVLELLVHVDPRDVPSDLLALQIDLPEDLKVSTLEVPDLPDAWQQEGGRAALQALGGAWLRTGTACVLQVPSVIVPSEWNFLINPRHADLARVTVADPFPFRLDERLIRR